jgi:hypothetical protein
MKIKSEVSPGQKNARLYLEKEFLKQKRSMGMAQVVENLLNKLEALSSKPVPPKNKQQTGEWAEVGKATFLSQDKSCKVSQLSRSF